MARPRHRPEPASRRQVEAMAGYGVPEIDIARVEVTRRTKRIRLP